MLINLLILALLVWAFLVGYSRGLVLQAIYSLGLIVSAIIAFLNYKTLAAHLTMWVPFSSATADSRLLFFDNSILFQVDEAFYAGLAFIVIFVLSYWTFCPYYALTTSWKKWKNYCGCTCCRSNLFWDSDGSYSIGTCTDDERSKSVECLSISPVNGQLYSDFFGNAEKYLY